MKRYALFAGSDYYPCGGWEDFVGSFDTPDEAREAYAKRESSNDWFQVIDLQTGESA